MNSKEIRERFLNFFKNRGHTVIPSASLVPVNDPSVLFTTAGMQPLVPYLLGETHPGGKRIANAQKCVRTQDIDDVGDNTHDTFFEMLGNWSLGDYFKEESIKWSYELLTNKTDGFGLNPNRLYITVFGGNSDAPKDNESFEIWKKYVPEERIYFLTWNGKKEPNWWDAGNNGPAGPDTEIFYDLTGNLGDMTKEEYLSADERQEVVEIWNNVFMEYLKKDGKVIGKLNQKNVDTGAGLERFAMVLQEKNNIFETDLFMPIMSIIDKYNDNKSDKSKRIIADHIRTAVFLISDGVRPSNTDRGYVLRRLIRRAYFHSKNLEPVVQAVLELPCYKGVYNFNPKTKEIINEEINKFEKTIDMGMKQFEKGVDPFVLFTTYGFPFELTEEIAQNRGIEIDKNKFTEKFKKHQSLSRVGADKKFKGGLSGNSEIEVKYHTATHLLHQALIDVLGDSIEQRGSNITPERLRFDFSFSRKLSTDEKKLIEDKVNQKINEGLDVNKVILPKAEAEKIGAKHFFNEKYPNEVSVYFIGETIDKAYSKEFCGGPHVKNTRELGKFTIKKEESVSAGVRRIKAVLE